VKKFFSKVWDEIKEPIITAAVVIAAAVITGGPGALAAAPAWVSASAAAISTAALDTGEGRQLVRRVGNEVFDDAFGMNPKAAYITSSIVCQTALTLGLERMFASIIADPAVVRKSDLTDAEINELRTNGQYAGDEEMFGPSFKTKGAFKRSHVKALTQDGDLIGSFQTRSLDIPLLKQLGANHASANMLNVSSIQVLSPKAYGIWGTCHQATNATLLNGGTSSTIFTLAPSWDMYVTTALYGNYGGQLFSKAYTGIDAGRNYGR
jgi:hypothetical protein